MYSLASNTARLKGTGVAGKGVESSIYKGFFPLAFSPSPKTYVVLRWLLVVLTLQIGKK